MKVTFGHRAFLWGMTAGLYSVGSLGADAASSAATDSGGNSATLEEIIVTAEKRAERLVDVPAVITAVSASDLADQNVEKIFDYYSRIPGLSFNGNKTYSLSLRGITTGGATNPTLAILVDDIQFGSSTAAGLGNSVFPDFDPGMLERIEVLHGPQGTLYGAASLGGLIKYVTREPNTEKFSGRVEAGFESVKGGDMGWTTRGSVNIPLVTDKIALSASGFTRWDPGWLDNIATGVQGDDVNRVHTYGYHTALLIEPIDELAITLSALQQKRHGYFANSVQVHMEDDNVPGSLPTFVPKYGENTISTGRTSDLGTQQLYSARVVWDVGGIQFTSLTSWGKSEGTNFQDVSTVFTFLPPIYGIPGQGTVFIDDAADTRKITQEFRVSGKLDQLDWRAGLYYTREYGSVDQSLTLFESGALFATPYIGSIPDYYKERAAFADATYHITSEWDLQAGVRYAKNDQIIGGNTVVDGTAQRVFGPSSVTPNIVSNDNSTTWEVSPIYHFSRDVMAYGRVATGYRPGGPNGILPNTPLSFAPDKVIDYEIGFKGIVPDHTFSWDAALFQINWSHVQLQDTNSDSELTFTTNGGTARSRGLELSVGWRPYKGLNIAATTTLMDAVLTEDLPVIEGADGLIGHSGDRLPASARFSSNLDIQQDFPLRESLMGYVGANWSYIGARPSEFVNSSTDASRFNWPSYNLLDLRTGLTFQDTWHLNVFVRNITDKNGVVQANNRNGTSVPLVNFLQPRTIGMSVAKDF